MNLSFSLIGWQSVTCGAAYSAALLALCLRESITIDAFCGEADGTVRFRVSLAAAQKIQKFAAREGIRLTFGPPRGLPPLLWRYRRRAGLFIGFVLIFVMLFFAERFVWDIQITGNTTMTESEVREELRACGFGIGSYIPSVHAATLENRVLLLSDRIAWISVYMDGTIARVQVIEQVDAPPVEDRSRPANLIAREDGQIELIELYRGNCVVTRGQAVKKGDLLVSGLYDSSTVGYRYTRAAGRVLARTERELCVEIPLSYTEKSYETPKYDEICLKFFDYSLKIFKYVGNETDTYDIIKEEVYPSLLGSNSLPVGISLSKRIPYTEWEAKRTVEEALDLAFVELDRQLAVISGDVELLEKEINTELGERSVILRCRIVCIADIAEQKEFEIVE